MSALRERAERCCMPSIRDPRSMQNTQLQLQYLLTSTASGLVSACHLETERDECVVELCRSYVRWQAVVELAGLM
jgi:hypothetical protein